MDLSPGDIVDGVVTKVTKFGAFVDLGEGKSGLVHISEIADTFVKNISDHISEGDEVKVKVLSIDEKGKIALSIKDAIEKKEEPKEEKVDAKFEDLLSKFMKESNTKLDEARARYNQKTKKRNSRN
ncbi:MULTISPECIES: S1 RNA-binding domain-containing protein [Peptoniphilus]|jgi:S1 RNA binding domain containing protein|uniref:S1 RNA-binding domain-containing protein n=1 Tax=Peptoniphilus TaxID=162289 RepID=UPI000287F666|nr:MULTISPECIES: S1 RNA-binding domain-containing protein [Peptoniphilus]MBS6610237.1 S1 RNA-binding domain-containing protein [Peptoniphilus harei]MDU1043736.1 S1 RNA-binding domain-containing protein [Peptoniphilus rhinitidis]MDU1955504.1 S1 RNA-binding domain-containing protein [Peptoniphilus lacydonensis]MDU2109493.1 S1 RNA-binding domain-containing protein [Peptoniphilus lacydonensis]MDU2115522.1 S1 RNA-binding domain-containing protein [Peptoniphilus lacydonensis]